jgi:hypothetical protein
MTPAYLASQAHSIPPNWFAPLGVIEFHRFLEMPIDLVYRLGSFWSGCQLPNDRLSGEVIAG